TIPSFDVNPAKNGTLRNSPAFNIFLGVSGRNTSPSGAIASTVGMNSVFFLIIGICKVHQCFLNKLLPEISMLLRVDMYKSLNGGLWEETVMLRVAPLLPPLPASVPCSRDDMCSSSHLITVRFVFGTYWHEFLLFFLDLVFFCLEF
ncbi:hypothetical protein C0J52_03362, partial [Blattella germanica]